VGHRCPSYVLDPRLQDGKKIPKWEPRARQGQFLGYSKDHATTIGLIRNIRTGYISPQFHVVYDEDFTTVTSDNSIDLTEHWIDLFLNSRESYLDSYDPSVDGNLPELHLDYEPPPNHLHQGELPREHVGQGKPSQAVPAPTISSGPARQNPPRQARQPTIIEEDDPTMQDHQDPQEFIPPPHPNPNDSSRVIPDNQLFEGFDMQPQRQP